MKRFILSLLLCSCCTAGLNAQEYTCQMQYDQFFCMSSVPTSSVPIVLVNRSENPYSRALGERIAGYVILGTAVLNLAIAKPMGQMQEELTGDGEMWTGLILTEGIVRGLLGAVFLTTGYVKYSRWKKWENEHAGSKSYGHHLSLNIDF